MRSRKINRRAGTISFLLGILFVLIASSVLPAFAATETITYDYYDSGAIKKASYSSGVAVEYDYDDMGNRTTQTISLFPKISVSPSSLDFGSVSTGTATPARIITIINTGIGDLSIGAITLSGANITEFALQADTCSGAAIASQVTCQMQIAFNPVSTDPKHATLTILSNDLGIPSIDIALRGTGTSTLTVSLNPASSGTVTGTVINCFGTCSTVFSTSGVTEQLTATPNIGYHFLNWSGDINSVNNPETVSMDANKTVAANFAINTYTITATAGAGGSITPSSTLTVNHGTDQAFSITPNAGYAIANLLVDGVSAGSPASYTFTNIAAGHTMEATFKALSNDLTVSVATGKGRKLSGIKVYAFTSIGAYTGINLTTDANGKALFKTDAFAPGSYKFRADYLGYQFWTGTVSLPGNGTIPVLIVEETAEVNLVPPVSGVKVYLFSGAATYLGISGTTDATGKISFELPVGKAFKFRADNLGNQYWSAVTTISAGGTNTIPLTLGGGTLRLTVQKTAGSPMTGLKTYLFNKAGTYLGLSQTTDAVGIVRYNVSSGDFRIRVDYLGFQFWTPDITLSADTDMTFEIPHQAVTSTVNETFRETETPLEGLKVYLFNSAGTYLNINQVTGADGRAVFDLPQKEYKVRADYLGKQFWSSGSTWLDTAVSIPSADAEITVTGNGSPIGGVRVYVFSSSGTYLNVSGITDTNGMIVFRLPAGAYKFRADYQAKQFWTLQEALGADEIRPIAISTGGGSFTLTVLKGMNIPLSGLKCYVFNEGGPYLNMSGVTDGQGKVTFGLADGSYQFRVDYLGYQFWTGVFTVPHTLDQALLIDHQDVTVTVQGRMDADVSSIGGVKVYLFSPSGAYLNINQVTDANGTVTFNLPQKDFMVRVDYLGQQFWSSPFAWQNTTVDVPEGIARVHVSMTGKDIVGDTVYVYASADAYLGVSGKTAEDGIVDFRLPVGSYKFRADYQGQQFKVSAGIARDIINNVEITSRGADFILHVDTGSGPLSGAQAYVFSSAGSYLGISGTTDASGQVVFSLADGSFKARVDYLGYQYWTDTFTIPATTETNLTISHRNTLVTVQGILGPEVQPLSNVPVYLFTPSGSYQGQTRTTDINGQAYFFLPDAEYTIRADYLGGNFWSDIFRFTDMTVTISEDAVRLNVNRAGEPVADAKVYLFSETGSYLGRFVTTDAAGIAEFVLPDKRYNFRIDEGGRQYWSGLIDVQADQMSEITIDLNGFTP